jgi:hypothetical protein
MVPLHNTMRNTIQSALSPRVVPRTVRKEAAAGTSAATGTPILGTSSGKPDSTPVPDHDPAADFKALFGSGNYSVSAPTTVTAPKAAAPTLESVFGGSPYVSNPGGTAPNGVSYGYNPTYFATQSAADKLAQMYGGTVVEKNAITPYGPFQQNQMNQMIQFPNGNVVNAGILASYFDRGWSQEQINGAIAGEINQIPG